MRTIAAAMLVLALPVAAQAQMAPSSPLSGIAPRPQPGGVRLPFTIVVQAGAADPFVERELRDARRSIERRRDSGELTRREARRLRREAERVARLSERYGRDGLSNRERDELQLRATTVRARSEQPRLR